MTREEVIAFFKSVEGKAIRWSSWSKDQYLIPEELHLTNGSFKHSFMRGKLFNLDGTEVTEYKLRDWWIEASEPFSDRRWIHCHNIQAKLEVMQVLSKE